MPTSYHCTLGDTIHDALTEVTIHSRSLAASILVFLGSSVLITHAGAAHYCPHRSSSFSALFEAALIHLNRLFSHFLCIGTVIHVRFAVKTSDSCSASFYAHRIFRRESASFMLIFSDLIIAGQVSKRSYYLTCPIVRHKQPHLHHKY